MPNDQHHDQRSQNIDDVEVDVSWLNSAKPGCCIGQPAHDWKNAKIEAMASLESLEHAFQEYLAGPVKN